MFMNNEFYINKVYELLKKDNRIVVNRDGSCFFIECKKNGMRNLIKVVKDGIYYTTDDDESYDLIDYQVAIDNFFDKLEKMVEIGLYYTDLNGNERHIGCTSFNRNNKALIEETLDMVNDERNEVKDVEKMEVYDFFGDFWFEAKWNGTEFIEI